MTKVELDNSKNVYIVTVKGVNLELTRKEALELREKLGTSLKETPILFNPDDSQQIEVGTK